MSVPMDMLATSFLRPPMTQVRGEASTSRAQLAELERLKASACVLSNFVCTCLFTTVATLLAGMLNKCGALRRWLSGSRWGAVQPGWLGLTLSMVGLLR